jgi:two-component system, NarL family, nitrate/nitrite response regulator NarL
MKLFICSNNNNILSRWSEILSSTYKQITSCHQNNSLSSLLEKYSSIEIADLDDVVILYHLVNDANEEKTLYSFLSQFPIAKRMIVLVNSPDNDQGIRLLFSGIHGYANVYLNPEKLRSAVKVVEQGEIWAGEEILMKLLSRQPVQSTQYQTNKELNEILSNREKQIVDRVLKGNSNKEVAMELNITERTVKAHLTAIYRKTKTKNRFDLSIKLRDL